MEITNALTKDLKIKEDNFLVVSIELNFFLGDKVSVTNYEKDINIIVRTDQFYGMLNKSCDWEGYLII